MSSYLTASQLMRDAVASRYYGKTILDYEGKPFVVARIDAENDNPDPGWQIWFRSNGACFTHLAPIQVRCVGLDDPLPEIWPTPVDV